MDYSNFRDDEINMMVKTIKFGRQYHRDAPLKRADYVNDGALSFELMVENKIGLTFRNHKKLYPVAKPYGSDEWAVANARPGRAVAECFLIMNDKENRTIGILKQVDILLLFKKFDKQ